MCNPPTVVMPSTPEYRTCRELLMKLMLIGWVLAMAIETALPAAGQEVLRELAPTGKLRIGVAVAPVATPVFAVRDAVGEAHGVPRDLGAALAESLGIAAEFVLEATTGEIAEQCGS